jgi:hypothetical protein
MSSIDFCEGYQKDWDFCGRKSNVHPKGRCHPENSCKSPAILRRTMAKPHPKLGKLDLNHHKRTNWRQVGVLRNSQMDSNGSSRINTSVNRRGMQILNALFGVAYRERQQFSVRQLGYLGYRILKG